MSESIHHSESIYNCLRKNGLCQCFTHTVIKHIMAILIAVFSRGYKGKTAQFAQSSPYHRTTVAHFLNRGKWDSDKLEGILQQTVIDLIYGESMRTGKPVLCLADDTISSKAKPSSRAEHPIEDASWHQSHLKKNVLFFGNFLDLLIYSIKLPLAHGNEADVGIRFTQERSELTDLLFDSRRENHTVGLYRANRIKAFFHKRFHNFDAGIPTVAQKIRQNRSLRQLFCNVEKNLNLGARLVVQNDGVIQSDSIAGKHDRHGLMSVVLSLFEM